MLPLTSRSALSFPVLSCFSACTSSSCGNEAEYYTRQSNTVAVPQIRSHAGRSHQLTSTVSKPCPPGFEPWVHTKGKSKSTPPSKHIRRLHPPPLNRASNIFGTCGINDKTHCRILSCLTPRLFDGLLLIRSTWRNGGKSNRAYHLQWLRLFHSTVQSDDLCLYSHVHFPNAVYQPASHAPSTARFKPTNSQSEIRHVMSIHFESPNLHLLFSLFQLVIHPQRPKISNRSKLSRLVSRWVVGISFAA